MEIPDTLTLFAVFGFAVSFISGALSQLWKSSVEVQGQITKRLTPAGWLSLGISMVGLTGAIASALIKMNIENDKKLQADLKAELSERQAAALREQEGRWQNYVKLLLEATKTDIETNIGNTILGFQQSQTRFNQAQAALAASKQSLLEDSLRQTNQIVLAAQPLTSLSLHWRFASADPVLRDRMQKAEDEIQENAESSQGGSTRTPIEFAEYDWQLVPMLWEIARVAGGDVKGSSGDEKPSRTAMALIPLDDSQNTVLSFGYVDLPRDDDEKGASEPETDRDAADEKGNPSPSTQSLLPHGGHIPWVKTALASSPRGLSRYSIDWELDPSTLARSVHRRNSGVALMASLPRTLRIALIHDARLLPVDPKNYSVPVAVNLWSDDDYDRTYLRLGPALSGMALVLEANGFQATRYSYTLKSAYRVELQDEYSDDLGTGCVIFEFERA